MILVCRDDISTSSVGTNFTLRLHWEIIFHLGKAGQFSTFICLDLFKCSFNCPLQARVKILFHPLRKVEKVTWENFIQTKRDPSSIKERSCLARMKLFTCSCRIYLMINNGRKRWRQGVVYQQKNKKQSKEHILRRFNPCLHLLFKFSPLPNKRMMIIPLLLKELAQICRWKGAKLMVMFSIEINHSYYEIMSWESLHIGTNGFGYTVFYISLYFLYNLSNVFKYNKDTLQFLKFLYQYTSMPLIFLLTIA